MHYGLSRANLGTLAAQSAPTARRHACSPVYSYSPLPHHKGRVLGSTYPVIFWQPIPRLQVSCLTISLQPFRSRRLAVDVIRNQNQVDSFPPVAWKHGIGLLAMA